MKSTGVCNESNCFCSGCGGSIKMGAKVAFPSHDPDTLFHMNCFKEPKQKHGGSQRFDKWERVEMMYGKNKDY